MAMRTVNVTISWVSTGSRAWKMYAGSRLLGTVWRKFDSHWEYRIFPEGEWMGPYKSIEVCAGAMLDEMLRDDE